MANDRSQTGLAATEFERSADCYETAAWVTAAQGFDETIVTAHGDGTLRIFKAEQPPKTVQAHAGPILAMVEDIDRASVLTGGDDGELVQTGPNGEKCSIAGFGNKWVDCVAASAALGWRAASQGCVLHLFDERSNAVAELDHESSIQALAFEPEGNRLAVAHYSGVTIWEPHGQEWLADRWTCPGLHIGLSWSPHGRHLVSAIQENTVHSWRLADGTESDMAGFGAKPRSLAWFGEPPLIASAGLDEVVCWRLRAQGQPTADPPFGIAFAGGPLVTSVLAVPNSNYIIAGFEDGAVLLSEVIPEATPKAKSHIVRGSTGFEVTALAVTHQTGHILIGDERGAVLWATMTPSETPNQIPAINERNALCCNHG